MSTIITTQINSQLQNAIFNTIRGLNLNISNPVLQRIVSNAAEQFSVILVSNVNTNTNSQITNIPKNLLGTKNPVDLNKGNLGSTGVTNNLSNILNTQLSSQLTNQLVNVLTNELKTNLPPSQSGLINYSNLADTLVQNLTPTIDSGISSTLSGFVNSLFGRSQVTPPSLPNVTRLFSSLTSSQALESVNNQFASRLSSKYLNQASNFKINTPDNQDKLIATKIGFIDPNANYPTKEYSGASETNKLARGDVRGTVVQSKNNTRMTGAKLPGGEAWDQPPSPFKGEYPYNKVTQTEAGHIIEIDDTPGSERLHIYHKSGTFIEIDVTGSVVKRAVGSSYEIIDKNGKISIAGKADISVNGQCNIFVGNDANIEVDGDTNLICHNDITAQAGGKMNLSAVEEINLSSRNVNIQAYNSMNIKSNVNLNLSVTNNLNLRSNVTAQIQSTSLYLNTTNSYHQTVNNYFEKHGGSRFSQAGGSFHFLSSGQFNADGSAVYLNSGYAAASQNSRPASIAGPSNIGIISGRRDIQPITIEDPNFVTLAEPYALRLEEDKGTTAEYQKHRDLILVSGFATAQEFDTRPIVVESFSSVSGQTNIVNPDPELKKYTELPGNYNLSPNFTVEMLSTKATLTSSIIDTEGDLPFGDIILNLQAVALNILEPAYNIYPTLVVASGYRNRAKSSENSEHPLGQCVDIQFTGLPKEEYYTYAKQLAQVLNYDQLILNYCNYTNSPWIHISFKGSNNRKQVMTFWNNRKHSNGLAKLR